MASALDFEASGTIREGGNGALSRATVAISTGTTADRSIFFPKIGDETTRDSRARRTSQIIARSLVSRSGRPCGLSNDEMLNALRRLWRERGYLTEEIIRTSQTTPNVSAYFTRFGSLRQAYQLIGFIPDRERARPPRIVRGVSNEVLLDALRDLLRRHGRLSKSIIDASETCPAHSTIAYRFGGLLRAYMLIGYKSNWYGERHSRPHGLSDEQMLDALRNLSQQQGHLSQKLIRKVKTVPSYYDYCRRFGTLSAAYRRIGFAPTTHPNTPPAHRQHLRSRKADDEQRTSEP